MRYKEDMSMSDYIVAMAEGNIGAVIVLADGSNIWFYYNDLSGQDIPKLVAMLEENDPPRSAGSEPQGNLRGLGADDSQ